MYVYIIIIISIKLQNVTTLLVTLVFPLGSVNAYCAMLTVQKITSYCTRNQKTYDVDDDIIKTDAGSRKYWRHNVTESLAGSCSYSHHSAAWNVQSKHCALLQMYAL